MDRSEEAGPRGLQGQVQGVELVQGVARSGLICWPSHGMAPRGQDRPFFQSLVDAIGVSRERVPINFAIFPLEFNFSKIFVNKNAIKSPTPSKILSFDRKIKFFS